MKPKKSSTESLSITLLFFLSASLLSETSFAGCCVLKNAKCTNTDTDTGCEIWYGNKVCKKK